MSFSTGLIHLFPKLQNQSVFSYYEKFPRLGVSGAGNFASKAFLFADIFRTFKKGDEFEIPTPVIWLVNDVSMQEEVVRACQDWFGPAMLVRKPKILSTNESEQRINILHLLKSLHEQEPSIIVLPYNELMELMPLPAEVDKRAITIAKGDELSTMAVFEKLINEGYKVSDDEYLDRGQYRGKGESLSVFPVNSDFPVRIEFDFDAISRVFAYDQGTGESLYELENLSIYSLNLPFNEKCFFQHVPHNALIIDDELEVTDEHFEVWEEAFALRNPKARLITFTSFPEDEPNHVNVRNLSVLKYQDFFDVAHELKEKTLAGWNVVYFTKHAKELSTILEDRKVAYAYIDATTGAKEDAAALVPFDDGPERVRLIEVDKEEPHPYSFQLGDQKVLVISDRDVTNIRDEKKKKVSQRVFWEFLNTLKDGDLVVHINHGVALFDGLERRTIDNITREYLKLCYAENDKLFVPIDQADKVNKFVGSADEAPKLTRLGSAEWATMTKKVKRETEQIAQELLKLYAQRKQAKATQYKKDAADQQAFEESFPYEETPGQLKAIQDVKKDLEGDVPMDRLICGDVGFGKTEVAMRAAFKVVANKKQVALISPITILTDQHYRSFKKRMEGFHVRVDMLSRFRSAREQKDTLERLKRGEIDIIVGTHRLLQKDVAFKDLGLVIIDEEQRFGVKQKEELKKIRTEVHVLTMTATPIPRTLNICLNKLRDISTITTPPPGRLPVVTEVRRYSNELIREAIMREIGRGGQVYFLHNRVQTIDAIAERLKQLVPEARFCVAHGKLLSKELEERIVDFKEHKFDVLVSSTIIENGIDLANANTLIVNNAEKFGLAQLYQLRGRVGRSKTQAYAYFLYHSQRLRLDAKKRLRAIVEASELGAGFQIAMKDLEIRGAGDILGVNQHGVINVVGVSHFIRMLNRAVEDLQAGKKISDDAQEEPEVSIELPITAYVPDDYITSTKDKINIYQRMAGADTSEYLEELKTDVIEEYGKLPREVANLFRVIELKMIAKRAGVLTIKAENIHMKTGKQISLYLGKQVKPENIIYMLGRNPKWTISGSKMYIGIEDLGLNWFDELKECVKMLGEKVDKGDIESKNKATGSVAK